jgi:hypothetical protein
MDYDLKIAKSIPSSGIFLFKKQLNMLIMLLGIYQNYKNLQNLEKSITNLSSILICNKLN